MNERTLRDREVSPQALIDSAARIGLFTLHAKRARKRETKASKGARARALRARQLVKSLEKQIDRLPAPDYPGGRELTVARESARQALTQWHEQYLVPLERGYQSGLVVAPSLLSPSTGGAPPKTWLAPAGRAALIISARDVAHGLIRAWRAYTRLPASHPNHATVDDLCALLLIPPKQRSQAVDATVDDLAREFLTERISKAAARQRNKSTSR